MNDSKHGEMLSLRFKYLTIQEELNWDAIAPTMPYFEIPSGFEVKIDPPFCGATCRFTLRKKGDSDKSVSFYYDHYCFMGSYNSNMDPYWEIYPDMNDDILRFAKDDIQSAVNEAVKIINSKIELKKLEE